MNKVKKIIRFVLWGAVLAVLGFLIFSDESSSSKQDLSTSDFRSINTSSSMVRGSSEAKVSMIQYSDFLCPSCSYVSTQVMPKVEEQYIANGKVRFEFRPMAFIAPGSVQAGIGAYCAIDQNKFWQYHDIVYKYVSYKVFEEKLDPTKDIILTAPIIKNLAMQAELNESEFNECLDSQKYLDSINQATKTANANGITSTPYVLVNGQQVKGNPSLTVVEAMIKAAL